MEGHTFGDVVQELSKWFDERVDGWISGWKDGRMDAWMNGWADSWMIGYISGKTERDRRKFPQHKLG